MDRRRFMAAGGGLLAAWWLDPRGAAAQAARLARGPVLDVRAFGARGDGTGDDAEAIRAAVAAAQARGGGTVAIPPGRYRLTRTIALYGLTDVRITGSGATLLREDPYITQIFQLVGCTRTSIDGLTLAGGFDVARNHSTGSAPPILIGTTSPEEERTNTDIEISRCHITGGNWAGIMVYGRHGAARTVKNRRIYIHHNRVENSSSGIFVYKNADEVRIEHNVTSRLWQDGIAVDTRANTDLPAAAGRGPAGAGLTEANHAVRVVGNRVELAGQGAQGVGVLLKGDNRDCLVQGNTVLDTGVGNPNPVQQFGILISQDYSNVGGQNVVVRENTVRGVAGSGTTAVGIYLAFLEHGVVERNTVEGTRTYGVYALKCGDVEIRDNELRDVTLVSGAAAIGVDGDAAHPSVRVAVRRNRVEKGAGVAAAAVYVDHAQDASVDSTDARGFADVVRATSNAVRLRRDGRTVQP